MSVSYHQYFTSCGTPLFIYPDEDMHQMVCMDEVFDCKSPNHQPADGHSLIYCYTLDNGEQYIGQTRLNLRIRHNCHNMENQLIDRKLRTHRWHLFIVGEYPTELVDVKGRMFIETFGTLYPNGLNFETGGCLYKHHSDISKQKISKSSKGVKKSPEHCHAMSVSRRKYASEHPELAQKCRDISNKYYAEHPEVKERISQSLKEYYAADEGQIARERISRNINEYYSAHDGPWLGKHHTEESKKKMSDNNQWTPERKYNKHIEKIEYYKTHEHACCKPIMCVESGRIYPSIKEAARGLNILSSSISNCLSGSSKTAGGYRWRYVSTQQ